MAPSRGLPRYKPGGEAKKAASPNVVLTSVSLGGTERSVDQKSFVDSIDGSLMVQFSPMVLDTPEEVSCRYQLNGLEKHPTETLQREVRYGGVSPGRYEVWVPRKEAEAADYSGKTSFYCRVLPDVWQSSWIRGLAVVGLMGGIWAFVSLRTRTLNRRKSELEQAVAQRSAELLQKNKELEQISLTDPLTGTRNRRYFYETIPTDQAQTLRSHQRFGDAQKTGAAPRELIFVLVDIDRFKRVNDEMGHTAGDKLLQEVPNPI